MSYWDSSALLPLIVQEPASPVVRQVLEVRGMRTVWWASLVECHSALERRVRAGEMSFTDKRQAEQILRRLAAGGGEVQPVPLVRERAVRLLDLPRSAGRRGPPVGSRSRLGNKLLDTPCPL